MANPLNAETDVHLTVRMTPKSRKQADKIVQAAWKEELQVQGARHPVRVKHSHVLRLAIEEGLPQVLAKLRTMQTKIESEG